MKKLLYYCAAFIITAAFVLSCSKEEQPEPEVKSDQNTLNSISFAITDNPALTQDCAPVKAGDLYYITVTEGADITVLKPRFSVSDKATVKINGTSCTSGTTPINFSQAVNTIEVTSESGKTKSYKALVQTGKPNIDKIVYDFMYKYTIPGISYAISKNEAVVYKKGLGFAITESNIRTTPSHLFRLASCSKQFTALCIMKLVEQGKITLDQKVFGPGGILSAEFANASGRALNVTVRHLLSHTSGWTSDPDPMFTSSFYGQTLDQRINYVLTTATQAEPGTSFSYYNMGFGMLGKIIEKVSGKDFETYLKEVLATAGITDIHVGGDRSQRRTNEVVYYSQSGTNGYGNEMEVIKAAGGVIASTEEMMKLLFHIDGLAGVPDIITASTRTEMLTPSPVYNRYGLGWRMNHSYYPGAYYHGGNLAGTATMWVMGSTGNINCIILCNSRSYISTFDDELYGLMKDVISLASNTSW
ncbi:MAG: serine hydrolase domain-containing protein [Rikenellaceae bacterium]|nr:serine hydrolase domain-containing protein [Rikenellaceae bacterium]